MAKEKRLTIRLSEEEENAVRERAAKFQMPVSRYIRTKVVTDDVVMWDPEVMNLLRNIHKELRAVNVAMPASHESDTFGLFKVALKTVYDSLQRIENILLRRGGNYGRH